MKEKRTLRKTNRLKTKNLKGKSCFWKWPWGHIKPIDTALVGFRTSCAASCAISWCERTVWLSDD